MRKREALELLVEGGAATTWNDSKLACVSKQAYPSMEAIRRAIRHLPKSKGTLRPYVCPHATDGHLHLASER